MATPRGRGRGVSIAFDAAAQKAGMTKTKLRHMGNAYAIGDGNLFPVFFPQYIGRYGGTQILGYIKLYIESFEMWWTDIVNRFDKRRDKGSCVIGIYVANFRSMMVAPAFLATDQAGIDDWAAKIADLMQQIFQPGRSLSDIMHSDELAGIDLRLYIGPSVKTYAFNIWLHLQNPKIETTLDLKLLDEQRIAFREQEYNFLRARYGDIDP